MEYPKFLANIIIKGKIECLTGLHIGGSKDKLEIGGVDSPVLRNPYNRLPYIPGSSLKGKMRHLLEYSKGVVSEGASEPGDVSRNKEIVRLFGIGADEKNADIGPTRLIVRDSNPDNETKVMWENLDSELLYTEYKAENTINRITAAANPRFIERVVAGSKFDFEIVYGVYQMFENENIEKINLDLQNLLESLRLLEHSALGKSGTRGYGKIKIKLTEPVQVSVIDYQNNSERYKEAEKPLNENELKSLNDIKLEYK